MINQCNLFFKYLLLFLVVLFINACSFSQKKAHKLFKENENETFDVIIVPGVPFENNNWSSTMKARVYWSKYLFEKSITKNIMYSGSAVYSPYYEANIMALYAQAIGIPKENIYTETKAEHSTENIYYSYKKATKLGFEKIALATDPFQSKMLKRFICKKMKAPITIIPMVYDSLKTIEPMMINPPINAQEAYDSNFVSIIERESFRKRFRGTRGKNIDKFAY